MKKKFIFFTALILCLAFAEPALAADDMIAGTWVNNPRYITFGDFNGHPLVWRVLEVKDENPNFGGVKTAFLLLNDVLRNSGGNVEPMIFDRANNSFPDSDIKEWLNEGTGGFLAALDAYRAYMLDTTYVPGNPPRRWAGGMPEGTSKIFLLSLEEALNSKYFANNADRVTSHVPWWLRSPGFQSDISNVVFAAGEAAINGVSVTNMLAIRPALKIDLSPSSVFTALPISYDLTVKAVDGNYPIRGAKFTLAPGDALPAQNFSNSLGIARFTHVAPGEYTLTVSKPGYKTASLPITVPVAVTPPVSLTPDPGALPGRVIFGRYGRQPTEWDVLDIVNDRALLFAGALLEKHFNIEGHNHWAASSLREYLNSAILDGNIVGFQHEINFTTAETAAMDAAASPTGDAVFLLSSEEVYSYLTDAEMRWYGTITWLTRSPVGGDNVVAITPCGELTVMPVLAHDVIGWVRPAVWVDLNMLTFDRDTNTLLGIEE